MRQTQTKEVGWERVEEGLAESERVFLFLFVFPKHESQRTVTGLPNSGTKLVHRSLPIRDSVPFPFLVPSLSVSLSLTIFRKNFFGDGRALETPLIVVRTVQRRHKNLSLFLFLLLL